MGGGSSIEFIHTRKSVEANTDQIFRALLASKEAREVLFNEIANHNPGKMIECRGKISLNKLVWFFTTDKTELYPGFQINVPILNEVRSL
jgi:hypothetical protein